MHGTASKPVPAPRAARGFSLVEMLLAVFILGIGVISIAALFPAGIALQRQATDDTLGPIIAKNAFATIRSKLSQDDFGGFNDFGLAPVYQSGVGPAGTIRPVGGADIPQLGGDWGWMRPAFYTNNNSAAVGTIDMAVWDAVAKIAGKPLFRLLAERHGREADPRVFVSATDERFDVIVADPPAFIKRKKDQKNGEGAYRRLNEQAMRLLNKDDRCDNKNTDQKYEDKCCKALLKSDAPEL
jgi:prepilin-type N-terminal cleavage/methylation domain-containing protein